MSNRELRRHPRLPYVGPVRICSEDARGQAVYGMAQCVDLSESGLRIEGQSRLPVGTYVSLRADQLNLGCSARVKRVAQQRSRYVLGLELSQPMPDKTLAGVRSAWALRAEANLDPLAKAPELNS